MDKHEAYEHVPEVLNRTDRLKHENDILFITNYAMERGGVTGLAEFASWMHRNLAQAKRSGMYEERGDRWEAKPEVEILASYLKQVEYYGRG